VGSRYADKRTERFANGERVREFTAIERRAERRLRLVLLARSLSDLRAVPGNRLEPLKGDRKGQWSIRINDQWRICFVWDETRAEAIRIEITDYHD
jgi:proteic killer suppression protein